MTLKSVKIPLRCSEGQLEANERASAPFFSSVMVMALTV